MRPAPFTPAARFSTPSPKARTERGEEGIFLHAHGFDEGAAAGGDQFVFRQGRSRETSYARDYDRLIELLKAEREEGNILWVMGPAFAFDRDARYAMSRLIDNGYAHGLMAGNALATHDLAVIRCLCDRVMVMKDGAAVEEGNTEQVILEPREDYTRRLVDSVLCI